MKLSKAVKAQIDIMTKVLGYELVPASGHGPPGALPRFRPRKAWVDADKLGPKTKLSDVDPRRVIGVAISVPPKKNPDGYGILILCQRKSDMPGTSGAGDALIARARGYVPSKEFKVVFTGPVRMAAAKAKKKQAVTTSAPARVVRIGDRVGRRYGTHPGTVGCFVKVTAQPGDYLLSNNHVLADLGKGQPPDKIWHRPAGTSLPKQDIANLHYVHPIVSGVNTNLADCALAKMMPGASFDRLNVELPKPGPAQTLETKQISGQTADPLIMDRVRKCGSETGGTIGRVMAISGAGGAWRNKAYDTWFAASSQILIYGTPPDFADYGDSGSVVFNDAMDAAGIIFAVSRHGGPQDTGLAYANPMSVVLDLLNASL
jgi:hypothetical protein